MKSIKTRGEALNTGGSAIDATPSIPSDMRSNPADSDRSDDSRTIREAPESVAVAELVGPAGLPAPLYDPVPKDDAGRAAWSKLHALVVAVEALVAAGMSAQARPLVAELRTIVESARGPAAKVIELGAERSKRDV